MITLPEIENTITESRVKLNRLAGQREAFLSVFNSVTQKVGEAKVRLSAKDKTDEVLMTLQKRAHEKQVGLFEILLTQIMREVIPEGEKSIKFSLDEKAGKPSLNIAVSRGEDMDGNDLTESILHGSGGSVSNVICAGLRFVALERSGLRKFMVLDEPDCWLESNRIPAFANVIGCLGKDIGVQSLMISHHNVSLFEKSASSIQRLTKDEFGKIIVKDVIPSKHEVLPHEIAELHLTNFMSHSDTIIKLSSGMTAIIGQNDIGKSVILTALHALTEGDFDKEFIMHGYDSAKVEMVFGDGRAIECERFRTKSPAVIYRLWNDKEHIGKPVHESPLGKSVPEWASKMMEIRSYGDMDIQLGNQKSPIFLLDESGSKRADILSVGSDNNLLTDMQAKWKKMITEDKQTIKQGEIEAGNLKIKIETLNELGHLEDRMNEIGNLANEIKNIDTNGKETALFLTFLTNKINSVNYLNSVNLKLGQLPEITSIEEIHSLIEVEQRLLALQGKGEVPVMPTFADIEPENEISELTMLVKKLSQNIAHCPSLPVMGDIQELAVSEFNFVRSLELVINKSKVIIPKLNDIPVIDDFNETLLDSLSKTIKSLTLKEVEVNSIQKDLAENQVKYNLLIDNMGGVCPLCESHIEHKH